MKDLGKLISTTIQEFLNEQQSVETNNLNDRFYKWFGNSKIVEDGKPMICYHGSTDKNIKVFDISMIGRNKGNDGHYGYGIYFSTDIREAKTYGSEIYSCYIKISNPFIGNDEQMLQLKQNGIDNIDDQTILSIDFNSFRDSFKNNALIYKFLSDTESQGYEYAWDVIHNSKNSNVDFGLLNDISNIVDYTTLNKDVHGVPDHVLDDLNKLQISPRLNYGFEYEQSLHWITDLGNRSKEITDVIKQLGYDGVFYGSEIVVFSPDRIKSVNNDGSWDVNDNSIYS